MHKTYVIAFAIVAILSGGLLECAKAMTITSPSALGFATTNAALLQRVTVVCGNNGCSPVQTKRVQRRLPLKH
jgi:hypothetical protein